MEKDQQAPESDARTITDYNGREVEIPSTVESIVCCGVGALRYTCYMQCQDLVVGVEDYETKGGMSRLSLAPTGSPLWRRSLLSLPR